MSELTFSTMTGKPKRLELTPATLRAGLPFPVGEQPDEQDWYDAHAAAWEADIALRETLERAVIWAQQYFWRIGEKAAEAMMSAARRR